MTTESTLARYEGRDRKLVASKTAILVVDAQEAELEPEVLEAHRLAGDIDYILKVRVKNARAYDTFYQALISEVRIYNVTALLSMEEIKSTTVLPL